MNEAMQRNVYLLGEGNVEKLANSCILVFGVGGVGSFAAEALARCGVGKLILVDCDEVVESNLNRQIHATYQTIGMRKTSAMKERILRFNPNCEVIEKDMFYSKETEGELFSDKIDFVVDAIDTISSKMDLIETCLRRKIPFISSTGMANRLDPSKLSVKDLMKTDVDPLAKVMRNIVKKRNIKGKIPVVISSEYPRVQTILRNEEGVTRKERMPLASSSFVPASAGLLCASVAVRKLCGLK